MVKRIVVVLACLMCLQSRAESRKRIVVIDGGVSFKQAQESYMCKNGAMNSNPLDFNHYSFDPHGKNIVGLIGNRINKKKYCIMAIKAFGIGYGMEAYKTALKLATKLQNVVGVNVSVESKNEETNNFKDFEYRLILELLMKGIKVNVAAGNQGRRMSKVSCNVYPACLVLSFNKSSNFTVVGSNTGNYSNYSEDFKFKKVNGTNQGTPKQTGTSQSTAIFTGNMFKK